MSEPPEDLRARAHLHAALGQPGSGRLRYASAMHFHGQGKLSDAVLEVYRICSAQDGEDPAGLLAARGLRLDLPPPDAPDLAIRLLIDEIDRYLAGCDGPGIAEVRSLTAAWRDRPLTLPDPAPNAVVARPPYPGACATLRHPSGARRRHRRSGTQPRLDHLRHLQARGDRRRIPHRPCFRLADRERGADPVERFRHRSLPRRAPFALPRPCPPGARALCAAHRPAWLALRARDAADDQTGA